MTRMLPEERSYIAAPLHLQTNIFVLNRRTYFIREKVGLFKMKGAYDILDPDTKEPVGSAKETTPKWALAMRVLLKKQMLPMSVEISSVGSATPELRLTRGWTFLQSKVSVMDAQDNTLGYFKSKLFSFGGGFHVYNTSDEKVADVKGNWKGWDFKFINAAGQELGTVSKKFAGFGKEMFTTADNYLISINDAGAALPTTSSLLLAAGLAIDTVYNEEK